MTQELTIPGPEPESPTQEQLTALIDDPALREQAEAGELLVSEGLYNRPVLRDPLTKRFVKGSGRHPASPDNADVATSSAYKKRKGYREALEHIISVEGDGYGTFAWLVSELLEAAGGSEKRVKCEHPEAHHKVADAYHVRYIERDPQLLFRLAELLTGSAPKTASLDIHEEKVEVHVDLTDAKFEVYRKDPMEASRIKAAVEGAIGNDDDPEDVLDTIVDGDFTELEGEDPS